MVLILAEITSFNFRLSDSSFKFQVNQILELLLYSPIEYLLHLLNNVLIKKPHNIPKLQVNHFI